MPRAKGLPSRPHKKKVQMPVQADGSESTEMACNEDGEIDDVAAEDFDEDQGTVLESPGAVKRATAAQVHREAVEHTAVMRAVEKQFFEEEARVKRVFDEHERRLDDVHKPKRKRGLQTRCGTECAGGSRILLSGKKHS